MRILYTTLLFISLSYYSNASLTFQIEDWISSAMGGGPSIVKTDTVGFADVWDSGADANGADGISDIRVTVNFTESGGADSGLHIVNGTTVAFESNTVGGSPGDHSFFNVKVEFLTFEIPMAELVTTDFSASSFNGGSAEYEFGIIELLNEAKLPSPTVTASAIASYDTSQYDDTAGATDGFIDDEVFGLSNATLPHLTAGTEGVAYYTDQTREAGGSAHGASNYNGANYTGATGSDLQHWDNNTGGDGFGGAEHDYFTSAANRDAYGAIRGFNIWYGVFDVSASTTGDAIDTVNGISLGGSMNNDNTSLDVTPVPEPSRVIFFLLSFVFFFNKRVFLYKLSSIKKAFVS